MKVTVFSDLMLDITDVSEERTASLFRVASISYTLNIMLARSFETAVMIYHTVFYHMPEDINLH
jgi:hypothetical protein